MKQNSKLLLYLPLAKQQHRGGAAAAASCLILLHLQAFIHQPQLVFFSALALLHILPYPSSKNKLTDKKTNQPTKKSKLKPSTRSAQHTKFCIWILLCCSFHILFFQLTEGGVTKPFLVIAKLQVFEKEKSLHNYFY